MFGVSCRARRRTSAGSPRRAVLACTILFAGLAVAPTVGDAQTASDPVTGAWSGRIGSTAQPNFAVTLELRLAGAAVRGMLSSSDGTGDVTGTYDASTGMLHIAVVRVGEQTASLVFDGVAVQGTATGRVKKGSTTGTFVLTRSGASASQSTKDIGSLDRAQLRAAFDELNANIAKAAQLVPADRISWRPVGTVRTVGEVVGHVADAYGYYCGRARGRAVQWSDALAQGALDKPMLIAKLNDAASLCSAAFDTGSLGPLIANYGHASLHYGNLVTYLRLLGLVPPTSG